MNETYFSRIQTTLLDVRSDAVNARKDCSEFLGNAEKILESLEEVNVVVAAGGVGVFFIFPAVGCSFALLGAAGFFISRDLKILSRNAKDLLDSNLASRAIYVLTPEIFVDKIFKGTNSAPVLSSFVVMGLKIKAS